MQASIKPLGYVHELKEQKSLLQTDRDENQQPDPFHSENLILDKDSEGKQHIK